MKRILNLIAETYIWILPILSVPVLYLIKNNNNKTVFLSTVSVHLVLVGLALWLFTRKHSYRLNVKLDSYVPIAAILLILGATITFISATTFIGTNVSFVASYKFEHYWTSAGFLLGAIVSLFGFMVLKRFFTEKGEIEFHEIGFTLLLIGTILWFIHLSFRLTSMVWAADQVQNKGAAPPFYEMLDELTGFLYAVYMVFAYLSLSAYGAASLKVGLLPQWLSVSIVVFGLVSTVSFVSGVFLFGMPITIQIIPWLMGIYLMKRVYSLKT